jgi:anti-sigma B factor antagonist
MGSSDTDRTRRAEVRRFALNESEALRSGCDLVEVVGELDLAVAEQLRTLLARAGEDHDQIFIDLAGCEFIDSTGIAVILQAHRELAKGGKRLVCCDPHGQVVRVLSITGLTDTGLVFASVEEALAAGDREGTASS